MQSTHLFRAGKNNDEPKTGVEEFESIGWGGEECLKDIINQFLI